MAVGSATGALHRHDGAAGLAVRLDAGEGDGASGRRGICRRQRERDEIAHDWPRKFRGGQPSTTPCEAPPVFPLRVLHFRVLGRPVNTNVRNREVASQIQCCTARPSRRFRPLLGTGITLFQVTPVASVRPWVVCLFSTCWSAEVLHLERALLSRLRLVRRTNSSLDTLQHPKHKAPWEQV